MLQVRVTSFIESPHVKSFLFECAKYWASEGNHVCYISNREQQELPPSLQGTNSSSHSYAQFMKITFVVAPNFNSFMDYLLNIPKSPHIPKVLVVEDITSYTNSGSPESEFLSLCSFLKHVAHTCSKFHKSTVFLIISVKFDHDKLNLLNVILNPDKIWRTLKEDETDQVKNFSLQEISTNPILNESQKLNFSLIEKNEGEFLRLNNIKLLFEESCNFNNKIF